MIGLIFDLDGTLLNTLEDLTDATNYALNQFGCPPRTLEEIRRVVGNGARNQICKSLPGTAEDPDPEQVLAVYKKYYNDHCQIKTRPYDGILDALADLSREYPVAIVSNKPDTAVKPLCATYFPGVYALGEIPDCPRKPAPDMVYKAMKDLQMDGCIYIGDSEVDIATAKNAGVPCLSVLWGFRDRDVLEAAGGTSFCETPEQMPAVIRAMEETYGK